MSEIRGPGSAPTQPEVPSPVDLAHFRQEMEEAGCLEASDDIVRTFLRTSPQRVHTLQEAAAEGDLTGVGAAAHALKGSLRVMEAHAIADQCERLEAAVRDGDIEAVRAGMGTFLEEFGRVTAFLEDALATDPIV
jgi:HPt (histidine-containing phosphotransfer) domain-containing protein